MPTEVMTLQALPAYLRGAITLGTTRSLCPACNGGSTSEYSLSIGKFPTDSVPVISMSCYRASCGWRAMLVADSTACLQRKVPQARPYTGEARPLAMAGLDRYLEAHYAIRPSTVAHWRATHDDRELLAPVASPLGESRGHITRTFPAPGEKKRVMTYKATAQPFLDWFVRPDGEYTNDVVVVVEDVLSNARVYQSGVARGAVALLGTNISLSDRREIEQVAGGQPIILALDRDAFGKACHYSDRFGSQWRATCLDADLKDLPDDAALRAALQTALS